MTKPHEVKLGELIGTEHPLRDAVHIAVFPAMAGTQLKAGDYVRVARNGYAYDHGNAQGIVDPFLKTPVKPGERFWVFLLPHTITSLRHMWTHPAFGNEPAPVVGGDVEAALEWFRAKEEQYSFDTDSLVDAVRAQEGYCFGDDDGPEWARTDEFWSHMEVIIGERVEQERRENTYFRCAC
jgi:hypothetical protein